jgi:DNA-binding LytR/AlgR family response regulator
MLPETFQRVHRSHIVNFAYAARIVSEGGARFVVLKTGTRVPIGRAYSARIQQQLIG